MPFILQFLSIFLQSLQFAIFLYVLLSWFPQVQKSGFYRFLSDITDPIFFFFRKFPHTFGPVDLSPLYAFFSIDILLWLLNKI